MSIFVAQLRGAVRARPLSMWRERNFLLKPNILTRNIGIATVNTCAHSLQSTGICTRYSARQFSTNGEGSRQFSALGGVNALYIARRIDTVRLFQQVFTSMPYSFHKGSVVVRLPASTVDDAEDGYAIFFDYGALVFFGLSDTVQQRCLRAAISTQRLSPRLPRCKLSWNRNAGNNTIG